MDHNVRRRRSLNGAAQKGLLLIAWAAAGAGLVTACGGGGGGEEPAAQGNTPPSENPQAGSSDPVPVTVDALRSEGNLFHLKMAPGMAAAGALDSFGGDLLAQWNPRDPRTALAPGFKVSFFGLPTGCTSSAANGPTVPGDQALFANAEARTGVALPNTSGLRWAPSGADSECDPSTQSRQGPSWVYLNPDEGPSGGVAMYTTSGPLANTEVPFFAAYGPGGIDGQGLNANGLGTFVAVRKPWWAEDAIRPWVSSSGGSSQGARIVSTQSVGSTSTGTVTDDQTIQVKQQIVVEFINTACQGSNDASGPCIIQYLFNTAVYRAGVTDWEAFAPKARGSVWFDRDQGSVPIIEGLLPTKGGTVSEPNSGLELYASAGNSTRHTTFKGVPFDVRISFDQLQNAMKLVTASRLRIAASNVSQTQLAANWGARWNDPSAWTLVHAMVGQEVYNQAFDNRNAWIGGGFRDLYVASVD